METVQYITIFILRFVLGLVIISNTAVDPSSTNETTTWTVYTTSTVTCKCTEVTTPGTTLQNTTSTEPPTTTEIPTSETTSPETISTETTLQTGVTTPQVTTSTESQTTTSPTTVTTPKDTTSTVTSLPTTVTTPQDTISTETTLQTGVTTPQVITATESQTTTSPTTVTTPQDTTSTVPPTTATLPTTTLPLSVTTPQVTTTTVPLSATTLPTSVTTPQVPTSTEPPNTTEIPTSETTSPETISTETTLQTGVTTPQVTTSTESQTTTSPTTVTTPQDTTSTETTLQTGVTTPQVTTSTESQTTTSPTTVTTPQDTTSTVISLPTTVTTPQDTTSTETTLQTGVTTPQVITSTESQTTTSPTTVTTPQDTTSTVTSLPTTVTTPQDTTSTETTLQTGVTTPQVTTSTESQTTTSPTSVTTPQDTTSTVTSLPTTVTTPQDTTSTETTLQTGVTTPQVTTSTESQTTTSPTSVTTPQDTTSTVISLPTTVTTPQDTTSTETTLQTGVTTPQVTTSTESQTTTSLTSVTTPQDTTSTVTSLPTTVTTPQDTTSTETTLQTGVTTPQVTTSTESQTTISPTTVTTPQDTTSTVPPTTATLPTTTLPLGVTTPQVTTNTVPLSATTLPTSATTPQVPTLSVTPTTTTLPTTGVSQIPSSSFPPSATTLSTTVTTSQVTTSTVPPTTTTLPTSLTTSDVTTLSVTPITASLLTTGTTSQVTTPIVTITTLPTTGTTSQVTTSTVPPSATTLSSVATSQATTTLPTTGTTSQATTTLPTSGTTNQATSTLPTTGTTSQATTTLPITGTTSQATTTFPITGTTSQATTTSPTTGTTSQATTTLPTTGTTSQATTTSPTTGTTSQATTTFPITGTTSQATTTLPTSGTTSQATTTLPTTGTTSQATTTLPTTGTTSHTTTTLPTTGTTSQATTTLPTTGTTSQATTTLPATGTTSHTTTTLPTTGTTSQATTTLPTTGTTSQATTTLPTTGTTSQATTTLPTTETTSQATTTLPTTGTTSQATTTLPTTGTTSQATTTSPTTGTTSQATTTLPTTGTTSQATTTSPTTGTTSQATTTLPTTGTTSQATTTLPTTRTTSQATSPTILPTGTTLPTSVTTLQVTTSSVTPTITTLLTNSTTSQAPTSNWATALTANAGTSQVSIATGSPKKSTTSQGPILSTTNFNETKTTGVPCSLDCTGVCNGNASLNLCDYCVGGTTNRSIDFGRDCSGRCNGSAFLDSCGYCVLNGLKNQSDFQDCKNICHTPGNRKFWATKSTETCNECLFPNETSSSLDVCGVCNGTGNSCKDCSGKINGTLKTDPCGICGGNSSDCFVLKSIQPGIIPSSTLKQIDLFGAGFNQIKSIYLIDTNQSLINLTTWKVLNSSHLNMNVSLEPGDYKIRIKYNESLQQDSTFLFTVYNKTEYKVYNVAPLEFTIGTPVALNVTSSISGSFKCIFYNSKNVSLGIQTDPCSVPVLSKSDRLLLMITLNDIDPIEPLFQLTAFAAKPSVTSSRFGNTGAEVQILFDQRIDTSKLNSCDQIFSNTSLLGVSAICDWKSLTTLSIVVGQGDNLVEPGSNLVWKNGSLKAYGESYAYPLEGSITVANSVHNLSTKAFITGPERLPVCGTVTFSGSKSTGSGGRNLEYKWTLDTLDGTESNFEVNMTELVEGKKYSLSLKTKNFMGFSDTAILEIQRENQAIPIVYITSDVNTESVEVGDSFSLIANVILPPCLSNAIEYLWSAKSNQKSISLESSMTSSNRYRVKKNTLPGGTDVVFTVKVSYVDNATVFSESSIVVVVKPSPLQPTIRGGSLRIVGADSTEDLVLDATLSNDPDFQGTSDTELKFDWSCLQESNSGQPFPCYIGGTPFQDLNSKTSPLVKLKPIDLQPNNKYNFQLTVYKTNRKASTNTIIQVVEGNPPKVVLEPLPRGGLVIPTEPLWVRTYIYSSSPIKVEWTTVDTLKPGEGYLNLTNSSNLQEPTITTMTSQNGVYYSILIIKPNILQKGLSYTIRVSANNSASSITGSAETKITILSGITSCVLQAPSSYTHLQEIILKADRCTTDEAAYPLLYQFFSEQTNGQSVPLSVKSSEPQTKTQGPRYNEENDIVFYVQVCNSFSICMQVRSPSVKILQLTNEQLVKEKEKVIDQVDTYLKIKDYYSALLAIMNVVDINLSSGRRKRSVVPVQVTEEITSKTLSIINDSLSTSPTLDQANDLGQIMSKLDQSKMNNTDLQNLFTNMETLVGTYQQQQTTLPEEMNKVIFKNAFLAPDRVGFPVGIIRQLILQIQSFNGKFIQAKSFSIPQVDSSSVFSVFGNPVEIQTSNPITIDVGQQITNRYRDWSCDNNNNNNNKCQGAIIRVLSYKDAKAIFPFNTTTIKTKTDIFDIGLYNPNSGHVINIANLTDEISLEMKMASFSSNSEEKLVCLYWNSNQDRWIEIGDALVNTNKSTVTCNTTHLSLFVVASKQDLKSTTGTGNENDLDNSVLVGGIAAGILSAILLGILSIVIWKNHKDRSNRVRPFSGNRNTQETNA